MRLTRQAALGIALACGLLAAVGAYLWIGQQSKPVEKAPETVQIPVPIQTIRPQTDLTPAMFKMVTLEKTQVPANAIVNAQDLAGKISLNELVMGKPVLAEQVATRSTALGMAYGIAQGQRAMTVALDIVSAVCDFVVAGNRVDVVAAFQREGKVVVRTLVQDVLVLAAGTATTPPGPTTAAAAPATPAAGGAAPAKPDNNPPKRPDMPFTLAVTPEQAQLIIAADVAGDLRLVLRRMGDHSIIPLPTANSWSLIGPLPRENQSSGPSTEGRGADEPAPPEAARPHPETDGVKYGGAPTAPPPVTPAKPSVEVIRGTQREVVTPQ